MRNFYIIVSYEKRPAGAVRRQRQKSWWSVRVRCPCNTAFYLAQNTNHNVKNRSGDRELSKIYMCYKVQREGWPKPQPDSFVLARRIVKIKCILNIVFKKNHPGDPFSLRTTPIKSTYAFPLTRKCVNKPHKLISVQNKINSLKLKLVTGRLVLRW